MSFFKAYDMRGTYGVDFDLDTVYRTGLALPRVIPGPKWLVGRDGRASSEAIRDALVAGLSDAGVAVTDIGLATTPEVYFFTGEDLFDGSVMITASHNPPGDNGLKVSRRGAKSVSYKTGLDDVERLVASFASRAFDASRTRPREDAETARAFRARYVAWHRERAAHKGLDSLRVVLDCSNGTTALFAAEIFPSAILLNATVDGAFPGHAPNPLDPKSREAVAALVREKGLDGGLVFDGDGDRVIAVDETGAFVPCDGLIPVVADETVPAGDFRARHRTVLHDVRSSRGVIEVLQEQGFSPLMVPVGASLAKPILRERDAFVGGELAGHYYFREFHFSDSGILGATRILSALVQAKTRGETFSALMRPILSRYANSGERNYRVADKDAAIARLVGASSAFGKVLARSDMDGLRVEFEDGWFNVRKSNTEPFLRLIVEHRSPETLQAWLRTLEAALV